MIIDGILGSSAVDSSAEVLDIEGADISDWEAGTMILNWNHVDGGAASIVGKVTYAKKIFKLSDCENDRQKMYWNQVRTPYIYGVCRIFDESGHKEAQAVAAIVRDCVANKEPIVLRFSVEGSTVLREGNVLKATVIRRVAITNVPCNRTSVSGLLEDPDAPEGFEKKPLGNKDFLEGIVETKKFEHPMFTQLGGSFVAEGNPILLDDDTGTDLQKKLLDQGLGYKFTHVHGQTGGVPSTTVNAHAPDGSHVGYATFHHDGGSLKSFGVYVDDDHQRKGLASHMYGMAQKVTGKAIVPSKTQTDEGAALWQGNAKQAQFGAPALGKVEPLLNKATTAGSMAGAPSTLTGGAALQREDVRKRLVNIAKAVVRDWKPGVHGDFKKFLKAKLPEAGDEFIDHFADEVDKIKVKFNLRKAENLSKMALKDISVGADKGGGSHDYTHVLTPEQKGAGYAISVKVSPSPDSAGKKIEGWAHHGDKSIGFAEGRIEGSALQINHSKLRNEHRGQGIGKALYESVMAHAHNAHGATSVGGEDHSTSASRVHESISNKHGLDYEPDSNRVETEEDYDEGFAPYEYTLKGEPKVSAPAIRKFEALTLNLRKAGDLAMATQGAVPRNARKPVSRDNKYSPKIDANVHGFAHLNNSEEQHALIHGMDVSRPAASPDHEQPGVTKPSWMHTAAGTKAIIKQHDGLSGDSINISRREVAYHNMARDVFGMGHYVPTTALFRHPHNGIEYSAQAMVPGASHCDGFSTSDHQNEALLATHKSGDMDKLHIMNTVLGNGDRHAGNFIFTKDTKGPPLRMIDHSHAFRYKEGVDTPGYVHLLADHMAYRPGNTEAYSAPHREPVHPAAADWVHKIDENQIRSHFAHHGIPAAHAEEAVKRLQRIKTAVGEGAQRHEVFQKMPASGTKKLPTPTDVDSVGAFNSADFLKETGK